jgi:uncharacterized membrane protein YgcG
MVTHINYTKKEIQFLIDAIEGKEASYQWLLKNNFRELAALYDYLMEDNTEAMNWLIFHKHHIIAAFLCAIDNHAKSFLFLGQCKAFEWAATIGIIRNGKDDNGYIWLKKSNRIHFINLALAIKSAIYSRRSGFGGIGFGSNFGSSGSSGFGGYGGGSFGGGGSGGSW